MYKQSGYNFTRTMDTGDMVLYSAKTGAVAVVTRENAAGVNGILASPDESSGAEFFPALLKNGFVVDAALDEYTDIKTKYEAGFHGNIVNIVVLPAETCDFACPYCFIYNYNNKIMGDDVYRNIKRYIGNQITPGNTEKKKRLKISWFGGEPLLENEKIISFMNELREEFDDSCVIYSSIVTNGFRLDYGTFNRLLRAGISSFQITFDGAKEDHDKTRKPRGSAGSYDVIVKNLEEITRNIKSDDVFNFAIRINFLKSTYKRVYGLIDDLFGIIGRDRRFQVYSRPVYNFETTRNDIKTLSSDIFTIQDGIKVQNTLTRYIAQKTGATKEYRMMNDYLPLPTNRWCDKDNDYSVIIGYDGSVYACDTLIGDESVCIGHLEDDGTIKYNERNAVWRKSVFEFSNFTECGACKRLPVCMGSCKRQRISGTAKPCLWSEYEILEAMKNYYTAHYGASKTA